MNIKTGLDKLDTLLETSQSMLIYANEGISLSKFFIDTINRTMSIKSEPIKVAYFDTWNDADLFIKRYTLEDLEAVIPVKCSPKNKNILYFSTLGISEIVKWYDTIKDDKSLRYIFFLDLPVLREFSSMFLPDNDLASLKEVFKDAKQRGISCIELSNLEEERDDYKELEEMFDIKIEIINNDGLDVKELGV